MNLHESIQRIKVLMESVSEFNYADKNDLNVVREDNYLNKYYENIDMLETEDGDVYLKHEDFHNNFIKLDDLVRNYRWSTYGPKYEDEIKLAIGIHKEEKEFITNFLVGTKYEYLIPHILNQKP